MDNWFKFDVRKFQEELSLKENVMRTEHLYRKHLKEPEKPAYNSNECHWAHSSKKVGDINDKDAHWVSIKGRKSNASNT